MKITTILGTRPEIIRMARIIPALDEIFEQRIIHTGQNSTSSLKDVFFDDLNIRKPDLQLSIVGNSMSTIIAELFEKVGSDLEINKPDAVVILGDTNSALTGILAKRMKIPFYHIEAGLRSFDPNVPEEINRRILDHTADFNLVYTENARDNLIREGLHPRKIALVGSPLFEVLRFNRSEIDNSKILENLGLKSEQFYLVSAHRQENIDDFHRLTSLISSLEDLAQNSNFPIIISAHPRIQDKINKFNLKPSVKLSFHEPFGFNDYCKLQINSKVVLSDSGSISEEAAILGFRAITLRDSMERPEALETGSIVLSGVNANNLVEVVKFIESQPISSHHPNEYFIEDTSKRVVKYIISTIHEYKFWSGIR